MKRILLTIALMTAGIGLWSENMPVITNNLPQWMVLLREAIYEQRLTANQIMPLYESTKTAAQNNVSGATLDVALSRCEFFIGRALQYEKREREAAAHYNEGMRLAERALAAAPSADAWLMRAENLSRRCSIGPWTFTIANGLDVERFAKNALSINRRNAAAQILIASRWIYAPAPFNNINRGINMMKAVLEDGDMEKNDLFNVYYAIGWGYAKQRNHNEARSWLLRAQDIYPTNKNVSEQLYNL
ncbi:MAG: hypothetical protein FWG89_03875 [Treponema sp.]|nr:hypothetical protein [Treponema sp.]